MRFIAILFLGSVLLGQNFRSPGANRISWMNNWSAIDGHHLVAYWDFGVGLADLYAGNTATLSGDVTRNSTGAVFGTGNAVIQIPDGLLAQGTSMTVLAAQASPAPDTGTTSIYFSSVTGGGSERWTLSRLSSSTPTTVRLTRNDAQTNVLALQRTAFTGLVGLSLDTSNYRLWRNSVTAALGSNATVSSGSTDDGFIGGNAVDRARCKACTFYTFAIYGASFQQPQIDKHYRLSRDLLARRSVVFPTQTWDRKGLAINPSLSVDQGAVQESSVVEDSDNCQYYSAPCIRHWHTCGFSNANLCYSEASSANPSTFTRRTTAVINAVYHGWVMKDGSTYLYYGVPAATNDKFNLYTSEDGISWSLDTVGVIGREVSGWDSSTFGNIAVVKDGETWRALYEARDPADLTWKTGVATSADGRAWTKYVSNPVMTLAGPFLPPGGKIGDTYWVWGNDTSYGRSASNPVVRYSSNDFLTWTKDAASTFTALTADEGSGLANGSIGDVHMIESGGVVLMYYTAYADYTQAPYYIKFAEWAGSLSGLVATIEGI